MRRPQTECLLIVVIFAALSASFAGCLAPGEGAGSSGAVENIPGLEDSRDWSKFSYVRTGIALDGGSIFQTYATQDGGVYQLWFPPHRGETGPRKAFWIVPGGKKYAISGSHNVNAITELLWEMRNKYHGNVEVREDISHAILILLRIPGPLWNFSDLRPDD